MTRHLGIDLGGTNIKVAVLDKTGAEPTILSTGQVLTGAQGGPDEVARRLVDAGRSEIQSHGGVDSVGLGVPGLFDSATGAIELFPNLPGPWPGYPLAATVSEGLEMPVVMINDARAFALAESTLGAGRGHRIVVAIVLGTGIGGGIIIDGHVHLGAFGIAGEIGHQIVLPDGPLCGCGNRGCVEALARSGVLTELAGKDTATEVFAAAAAGEARSLDAIGQIATYLGIGLANVITVLGPERIVIGGGLAEAGDLLLNPIRAAIEARVTLVPTDQISVVPAELGSLAGAIGAALAGLPQDQAVRAR